MHGASSNRRQVCAMTGSPATSRNNLSMFGPMRVPRPAATMMALVMGRDVQRSQPKVQCETTNQYEQTLMKEQLKRVRFVLIRVHSWLVFFLHPHRCAIVAGADVNARGLDGVELE